MGFDDATDYRHEPETHEEASSWFEVPKCGQSP
jgi:hypothetical protein